MYVLQQGKSSCRSKLDNIFRPVVLASQLFGAAPLPWKGFADPEIIANQNLTWVKFLCVLQNVWTLVFYGGNVYSIYTQIQIFAGQNAVGSSFVQILVRIVTVYSIIITTTIFIGCRMHWEKYNELAAKLIDLVYGLDFFDGSNIFEKPFQRHWKLMVLTVLLAAACVICEFATNFDVLSSFIYLIGYHTSNIIILLTLSQYNFAMGIVYESCKCARRAMESLAQKQSSLNATDLVNAVRILRNKNLQAWHLLYGINKTFGWLLINVILNVTISTSVEVLEIYQFCRKLTFDQNDFVYLFYVLVVIALLVDQIFQVLYPNHLVKLEMIKTGLNLCQFNKVEIMDEVRSFSELILMQEDKLEACGIVELDLSVLAAMVGVLTTYVVLMIQYDKSSYKMFETPT
ncbi:putative gustatory receptor 59f [Uranotaenia lowii]|uniref:putative gustatory receptor 59f n=1 Tax=Uranotaenia lowii TaxID=190385 RepID=UPI0024798AB2|nr:putative gustatory receptor 59f [Uranotaenia lowii]